MTDCPCLRPPPPDEEPEPVRVPPEPDSKACLQVLEVAIDTVRPQKPKAA
jgi:hypothetical protein